MTIGEKIKYLRNESGLSQKELAEKLGVTFQTVSKWESDINEPDISTIKKLCKIFETTSDYLLNDDEESETTEVKQEVSTKLECFDCGDPIDEDEVKTLEIKNEDGEKEKINLCEFCYHKRIKSVNEKVEEINSSVVEDNKKFTGSKVRRGSKSLIIWALIIGILAAIGCGIYCYFKHYDLGILNIVLISLAAGYCILADVYCIFSGSFVTDVIVFFLTRSIKFPGLIFSWSMGGLIWLIGMKILFLCISVAFGICMVIFGFGLTTFLSVFAFLPILISNSSE